MDEQDHLQIDDLPNYSTSPISITMLNDHQRVLYHLMTSLDSYAISLATRQHRLFLSPFHQLHHDLAGQRWAFQHLWYLLKLLPCHQENKKTSGFWWKFAWLRDKKWLEIEIDFPFPKFFPPVHLWDLRYQCHILDPETLTPVESPSTRGVLFVGGIGLARGYLEEEEKTKASCQGWIVDFGRVLHSSATGFLDILGDGQWKKCLETKMLLFFI